MAHSGISVCASRSAVCIARLTHEFAASCDFKRSHEPRSGKYVGQTGQNMEVRERQVNR